MTKTKEAGAVPAAARCAANDNTPRRVTDFVTTEGVVDLAARRAWLAALPDKGAAPSRKAAPTARPRHADLSRKVRSLLTWRAASRAFDWTSIAVANDNEPDERDEPVLLLLDSTHEVRPRLSEIYRAIKDVEFKERHHAKLGGGGALHVVPKEGDEVERGPVLSQRRKPECVVRLGSLRLSNGKQAEWVPVRTEVGIQYDWVRIPLGGIVDCKGRKPRDRFGASKGSASDDVTAATVGSSGASSGAMAWDDPVAEAQEAARVRGLVPRETANILDLALRAANFRDIGEALGHRGKHAERKGKAALLAACEQLDAALAA
jgi:hypothetical protein